MCGSLLQWLSQAGPNSCKHFQTDGCSLMETICFLQGGRLLQDLCGVCLGARSLFGSPCANQKVFTLCPARHHNVLQACATDSSAQHHHTSLDSFLSYYFASTTAVADRQLTTQNSPFSLNPRGRSFCSSSAAVRRNNLHFTNLHTNAAHQQHGLGAAAVVAEGQQHAAGQQQGHQACGCQSRCHR